ncbi:N-acetylneuraminate synthase family protein [Nitrosopumilus sp. S4]
MVFIVAEIGVNWDGDYEILKQMVSNAKNAGCDAVKFQAYKKELVEKHPESSRLIRSAISKENIERVDEICKNEGIEWFCTPMYEEAVDFLNPYVKRFKIREYDGREILENRKTKLFEKIWKTQKEVIISANKSPKTSKIFGESRVKWLYCVPKYPCKIEEIDFSNIKDFDGYSNHHPHFIAPLTATILGADIIEIHVTLDKSKDYIDNNVSFDFDELKNLIENIRKAVLIKK